MSLFFLCDCALNVISLLNRVEGENCISTTANEEQNKRWAQIFSPTTYKVVETQSANNLGALPQFSAATKRTLYCMLLCAYNQKLTSSRQFAECVRLTNGNVRLHNARMPHNFRKVNCKMLLRWTTEGSLHVLSWVFKTEYACTHIRGALLLRARRQSALFLIQQHEQREKNGNAESSF